MAKLTTAEFIEAIKELSVLELNELVKACEEEFGVSAAAGVAVVAAGPGKKDEPMEVKVGDVVIYGKYAGTEVSVEGKDYLIMKQSDILAIL